MKFKTRILFALLLGMAATHANAQLSCDSNYVNLNNTGTAIVVDPNGVDDTVNLQCAFDEATARGITSVQLVEGSFWVSQLYVYEFRGTFEGRSRNKTFLEFLEGTVDCSGQNINGMHSAALKFVMGDPRIRNMAMGTDWERGGLCMGGGIPFFLVHFTSGLAVDECSNDVIQAVFDRVTIYEDFGLAPSFLYAVGARPEALNLANECKHRLLGTLKVNRSQFFDVHNGIWTEMAASAQVDVNFNEIVPFGIALNVNNAGQSATILKNDFYLKEIADENAPNGVSWEPWGITLFDSPGAPADNRIAVENNTFFIEAGLTDLSDGSAVLGVFVGLVTGEVSLNMSFRGNDFQMFGPPVIEDQATNSPAERSQDSPIPFFFDARAINIQGGANGSFAGNTFAGYGAGIFIFNTDVTAKNNTISGNKMGNLNDGDGGLDMYLGAGTTGNYVGPNQGVEVVDDGTDNIVIADGNDVGGDQLSGAGSNDGGNHRPPPQPIKIKR
jgi:parallel beta-helix repeat protein